MPRNLLRVESNERIDLDDFKFAIDGGLQGLIRQPNENFLTNPAGSTRCWIIDGFDISFSGANLTVTKGTNGRAILAQREEGQVYYGAITTDGDASKTLDLSSYSNGTYYIYIRFQYTDDESQSRMFWNPGGSTEFAQQIHTRRKAEWSLRAEASSPSGEWVLIGEVTVDTSVITTIKDRRSLYFEGIENCKTCLGTWTWNGTTTVTTGNTSQVSVNDWVKLDSDGQYFKITVVTPSTSVTIENPHGYTIPTGATGSSFVLAADGPPWKSKWSTDGGGSVNDRKLDRNAYGVKDLQTFTAAVRQLFEDIRPSGGKWFEKRGLFATGKSGTNEPGIEGVADGTAPGLLGTASGASNSSVGIKGVGDVSGAATTSNGVVGEGAGTDGHGVTGTGAGTGPGVKGIASGASNSSVGVEAYGDTSGAATASVGLYAEGDNDDGIDCYGTGNGDGIYATADTAGDGVYGLGGTTDGTYGGYFQSAGSSYGHGIFAQANGISGHGADLDGTSGGYAAYLTGKSNPTSSGYAPLHVGPQTGAPANAAEGDIYVNSTAHTFHVYLNSAWKTVTVT